MKIISIHMKNFGPYVNEMIDFRDLNEQRLFLLEGKTGCGKSTIIDGVVFALYGQDTKGRDEGVRRNSAPKGVNAEVSLDFEVDGTMYRINRSPQMKDIETGKKKKNHSVALAEIDVNGSVIPGRSWSAIKEVAERVAEIIRLNVQQFTRIVVLPQGQFSKFLRSKSEERQALLEAIFPIDDWKAIQASVNKLAGEAKKEKASLLDATKQSAAVVANHTNTLQGLSVDEQEPERLKSIDEVNKIHLKATELLAETSPKLEEQADDLLAKEHDLAEEKKRIEAIERQNSNILKRANLLQTKNELDKKVSTIETHQQALKNHHDAKLLHTLLDAVENAKSKIQENKEQIAQMFNESQFNEPVKDMTESELSQRIEDLSDSISALNSLIEHEKQYIKITDSLPSLELDLKSANERCGELLLEQHQAWASEIANKSLREGEPCLVCGSEDHPTPASVISESSGALEEALKNAQEAERQVLLANQKKSDLESSISGSRTKLGLEKHTALPELSQFENNKSNFSSLRTLFVQRDTLVSLLDDSKRAWDSAEKPPGMESVEAIRGAIMENEKENQFTNEVEEYKQNRAINYAELNKEEIQLAEGKEEIDVSKAREILSNEEEEFKTQKETLAVLMSQKKNLEDSSKILEQAKDDYTNFASSVSDLQWVDEHLRGVNKAGNMQMDIVAWILRRWFEAALANANKRLSQIGSGRYSLEMTQTGKQDKKTGLNIGVIDALSDSLQPRSTASLSGGESFYISLALALGMSDVVSEEAGGITLGTLFIDEGFGTLDPETLDDVMGVIDDVGGNDRVIGLISHVEALKQRISSRISVTKEGDGTSTTKVEP